MNRETVTATEQEHVKICINTENFLLQDVVFIFECTSNFISLKQLQCNDIIY